MAITDRQLAAGEKTMPVIVKASMKLNGAQWNFMAYVSSRFRVPIRPRQFNGFKVLLLKGSLSKNIVKVSLCKEPAW